MSKSCTKCGITKSSTEFNRDSGRRDGLAQWCKDCRKAVRRENRERIKTYNERYRAENADAVREYGRQYYADHKDYYREYHQQYYPPRREQLIAKARAYQNSNKGRIANRRREHYKTNATRLNARNKQWKTTHPEQAKEIYTAAKHRRRAREKSNGRIDRDITLAGVAAINDNLCGVCYELVDLTLKRPHLRSPTIDHIVPYKMGGTHTWSNVQLAHLVCNLRKGARCA